MTGSFVVSILIGVTSVMATALLAVTLSSRRRAATRHALLTAAFVVALVLPAASAVATLVTIRIAVPAPTVVTQAVASFDTGPVSTPLVAMPTSTGGAVAVSTTRMSAATALEVIWLVGLAACLAPIVIGLLEVRSLGGRGLPWSHGQTIADGLARSLAVGRRISVVQHESVSGPMTYGTIRPTIVMPMDAAAWTTDDLRRAIVHELEHIRRADWLTQFAARALCAAYWFHPLVWMARRRLVLEAERASDDGVLTYAEASAYADQLVDLARRLSASHRPLLAMANRRDLSARVHALLDGRLPRGRAGTWLVAAISCLAAVLVAVMSPMRIVNAQAAGDRPRFDVVSVRPCDPNAPPVNTGRSMSAGQVSPGHMLLDCRPVNLMILDAYVGFPAGIYAAPADRPAFSQFKDGPEWIRTEKYTIEAETSTTPPLSVMRGPMLQRVLEDRFKLKTHVETREVPVLELVVGKGGAKLTPFKPGSCVPFEFAVFPPPPLEPGQRRCSGSTERNGRGGYTETVEAMTLDDWAASLEDWLVLNHQPPLVNRTGITGLQTFRRDYSGAWDDFAPELKAQLGLELRAGKAPHKFLVIDHVERPTPDGPAPLTAQGPGAKH
jgi:uncharacterized protein (TIGR03435 family)